MIPAMGLSMAVSTLVGQNIGAGNIERAAQHRPAWARLIGFGVPERFRPARLSLPAQLVAFFVPDDAAVIAAGRSSSASWRCPGASSALQFALTGVLRASGNMVITMVLTLVSQWVLQFPLAYVLSRHTSAGSRRHLVGVPGRQRHDRALIRGIYAKGDWKKKRLLDEEDELTGKVTEEILIGEGGR